jgi:predicted phage terminase large subunit-like protein
MRHFAPLFSELDRMRGEPVRLLLSVGPQHGKSTVAFHTVARAVDAGLSVIYATYSHDFATFQARRARRIAEAAGVRFRSDSRAINEWYTENGGVFTAVGAGGSVTGKPADLIFVDDPIKGYAEAASHAYRLQVEDWMNSAVLPRANPRTSIVVIHTRFHPSDLIGTLSKSSEWKYINLPAISDAGEALWPEERPIEFLLAQKRQLGDFSFAALYQGEPRPRGQEVFGAPTLYQDLPSFGYQMAIGVDFAYSAKSQADASAAVVMSRQNDNYYVHEVVRKQCSSPEFAGHLRALHTRYPAAKIFAYVGGTELGIKDFFRREGIPLDTEPARTDKFQRAQATAAAWNRGSIAVPATSPPWLSYFLDEIGAFTGVNDPHDDMIDAMCSAFDTLAKYNPHGDKIDVVRKNLSSGMRRAW